MIRGRLMMMMMMMVMREHEDLSKNITPGYIAEFEEGIRTDHWKIIQDVCDKV